MTTEKFSVKSGSFRNLLNTLSLEECKQVVIFLSKRIQQLERQEKGITQKKIEEYGFTPRIVNILKENNLNTSADLEEFGLYRLKLLRGIGATAFNQIREKIFT